MKATSSFILVITLGQGVLALALSNRTPPGRHGKGLSLTPWAMCSTSFFVNHQPPESRRPKGLLPNGWALLGLASTSCCRLFKEAHWKGGFGAIRAFNPDLVIVEHITTAGNGSQGIDRIRKKPVWLYSAIFSSTRLGGDVQNIPMNGHLTQNSSTSRACHHEQRRAHQKLDSKGVFEWALKGNHRLIFRVRIGFENWIICLKIQEIINLVQIKSIT